MPAAKLSVTRTRLYDLDASLVVAAMITRFWTSFGHPSIGWLVFRDALSTYTHLRSGSIVANGVLSLFWVIWHGCILARKLMYTSLLILPAVHSWSKTSLQFGCSAYTLRTARYFPNLKPNTGMWQRAYYKLYASSKSKQNNSGTSCLRACAFSFNDIIAIPTATTASKAI
eukprot:1449166-Pleurochrysis_carterae.AAC.2